MLTVWAHILSQDTDIKYALHAADCDNSIYLVRTILPSLPCRLGLCPEGTPIIQTKDRRPHHLSYHVFTRIERPTDVFWILLIMAGIEINLEPTICLFKVWNQISEQCNSCLNRMHGSATPQSVEWIIYCLLLCSRFFNTKEPRNTTMTTPKSRPRSLTNTAALPFVILKFADYSWYPQRSNFE